MNDRRVLNGIFWVLRSGAPWRDLPDSFWSLHHLLQSFRSLATGGRLGAGGGERQQRKWQAERQSKRGAKPCPHWFTPCGGEAFIELNEGRSAPSVFEQTDTMRIGAAVFA